MADHSNDTKAQYRKLLEDCETKATEDFDKTTVALSGGALAVSMAFIKDLAPHAPKWAKGWFLLPAWLALAVSLLGVLLSLMASMKSMRHELDCLDGRLNRNPKYPRAGGRWREWTATFNHVAIGCCISGIILLVCFAFAAIWSS